MMDTPYSYIFVRTDLTIAQQIVQASHAALEAGHEFGEHSHAVLFAVPSEAALEKAAMDLASRGIKYRMFFEPDDDVGYTALVTAPLVGEERKHLKKYRMYKTESVA